MEIADVRKFVTENHHGVFVAKSVTARRILRW
jgi:hypothetical protein